MSPCSIFNNNPGPHLRYLKPEVVYRCQHVLLSFLNPGFFHHKPTLHPPAILIMFSPLTSLEFLKIFVTIRKMDGYYGMRFPRCHSYDFILITIISVFMTEVFPLFEEINRPGKALWGNLESQRDAIISHRRSESQWGTQLRFPSSQITTLVIRHL